MRTLQQGPFDRLRTAILAACVVVCATVVPAQDRGHSPSGTQPVAAPLAVPTQADLADSNRQINEIFHADFEDTTPAGRRKLAVNLLTQAANASTPVEEYALLTTAREVAISAGDAVAALDADERISKKFKVDAISRRIDVVTALSKSVTTPTDRRLVIDSGFSGADDVIHIENYPAASSFLFAIKPLIEATESDLLSAWKEKVRRVKEMEADAETFKAATAVLQKNPSDPSSNLVVGNFYFLRKSDWAKALPFLAKGSDLKLKRLAEDELSFAAATEAAVGVSKRRLKLADQWWDAADSQPITNRDAIRLHARSIYQQIQAGLTGLTALRVRKRVGSVIDPAAAQPTDTNGQISAPTAQAAGRNANSTSGVGERADENNQQLKRDADELLKQADMLSKRGARPSTLARFELLSAWRERSGREDSFEKEPTAAMIPYFLSSTGYGQKTDDPHSGASQVSFAAVPLLASLYRSGQGNLISRVAHDLKQDDSARLTCLLAMHLAGDDLARDEVLRIYNADTRLENRELSLLMLGSCPKSDDEIPQLVSALDDDNQEIRVAALTTLGILEPAASLPKLKKVMRDTEPSDLILPGIRLLGRLRGDQASALLVDYMQKELADGTGERSRLDMALLSFSMTTGKRWVEAGAHKPEYYAQQARDAVAWWQANHQ